MSRFLPTMLLLLIGSVPLEPTNTQAQATNPACGGPPSSRQADEISQLMKALQKPKVTPRRKEKATKTSNAPKSLESRQSPNPAPRSEANASKAIRQVGVRSTVEIEFREPIREDQISPIRSDKPKSTLAKIASTQPLSKTKSKTASERKSLVNSKIDRVEQVTFEEPLPAMPLYGTRPQEFPNLIARVQAVDTLPSPTQADGPPPSELQLLAPSTCENCDIEPNEPSPCEACQEALSDESHTQDSVIDDEGTATQKADLDRSAANLISSEIALGSLQDVDLDSSFRRLDKLKDGFQSQLPADTTGRDPYFGSNSRIVRHWTARNLAHRELYFDDMPLERYGWSASPCKQAKLSLCEFLKDAVMFPGRHALHYCEGKCKLHYILAWERPGSCAMRLKEKACR